MESPFKKKAIIEKESNPEGKKGITVGKIIRTLGLLSVVVGGGALVKDSIDKSNSQENNQEISQFDKEIDIINAVIYEDGKVTISEVDALRSIWERAKQPVTFTNSVGEIVEFSTAEDSLNEKMDRAFDKLTEIAEIEATLTSAKEELGGIYMELQLEQNTDDQDLLNGDMNNGGWETWNKVIETKTPGEVINEQADQDGTDKEIDSNKQ